MAYLSIGLSQRFDEQPFERALACWQKARYAEIAVLPARGLQNGDFSESSIAKGDS